MTLHITAALAFASLGLTVAMPAAAQPASVQEVPVDLSDVYKRNFGLDLAEYNGKDRYVLPVPGTFVIDRRGIIRAAYANDRDARRLAPWRLFRPGRSALERDQLPRGGLSP